MEKTTYEHWKSRFYSLQVAIGAFYRRVKGLRGCYDVTRPYVSLSRFRVSQNKEHAWVLESAWKSVCKISIWGLVAVYGCGGTASEATWGAGKIPRTKPTEAEAIAHSTLDCTDYSLVGNWRTIPSADQVTIKANCYFETYYCGYVGFIASDATAMLGTVTVNVIYQGESNPGCLGIGLYRCAYSTANAAYHELELHCQ